MVYLEIKDLLRHITCTVRAKVLPSFFPFSLELVTADMSGGDAHKAISAAMESSDTVKVDRHRTLFGRSRYIYFEPTQEGNRKDAGLIIYPGGKIEAELYSPIARAMADLGFTVVITTPPFELAFTDIHIAENIMNTQKFKHVKKWAVSGHSLGGVIACHFARTIALQEEEHSLKGVALMASYPNDGNVGMGDAFLGNLTDDMNYVATSIYGTRDGTSSGNPEVIKNSSKNLPSSTKFVAIEGGNHTQFYYKDNYVQDGDNEATITREEQQKQNQKAIHDLLLKL